MKKTIPVTGCLAIDVSYPCRCVRTSFYIIFTTLHLEIRNRSVTSSPENSQAAGNSTEYGGLPMGFVHKGVFRCATSSTKIA